MIIPKKSTGYTNWLIFFYSIRNLTPYAYFFSFPRFKKVKNGQASIKRGV